MFGKKKEIVVEAIPEMDPTGWMIDNSAAEFFLLHTDAIRYMVMFGYTYLHGMKLFPTLPEGSTLSFRFVSMIFQCTGGGILVPIFINAVPVPLAQDAYPIAILASFLLHQYYPILRDVVKLSAYVKTALIFLYETMRAAVVVKLTYAAGKAIAPSDFQDIAVFGPIFCGTVAGCGGAFLPLNKGLDPIKMTGLAQPMLTAFIAATCFHLFLNTSLSHGVINAKEKAHVCVTTFFILHNLYTTFLADDHTPKKTVSSTPKKIPKMSESETEDNKSESSSPSTAGKKKKKKKS